MTSLDFTDIAEVGSKGRDDGSFLVQVSSVDTAVNAVVYSGILNEDVDGAPQCYGRFPADAGIDRLVNATNLVGGGSFNVLPKGVLAHPWKWVGVANMTHGEAAAAGLLARLDERSELAGRFSASAPMNDPRFPPRIPGTSRRQQPILRLYDRLGPQRGSPGNRSIALVGRDSRPLRGSHSAVKRSRSGSWRFRAGDPQGQWH